MKHFLMRTFTLAVFAAIFAGMTVTASAQSSGALPVPGYAAAKEIPGMKEMPDPNMPYKVVFDLSQAAPKMDQVHPLLEAMARFVNTLAAHGVPADHRMIAAVFHQGATDIILNNETFKERYSGHDNPNIAIIQALKKAGVDFRVCGQAVLARKIDPKTIQPEIELDLWALTTLVNFQLRGYVKVGN